MNKIINSHGASSNPPDKTNYLRFFTKVNFNERKTPNHIPIFFIFQ